MTKSILDSAYAGAGRVSRYGDFSAVYLHSSAFITTPIELTQNQNWARGRMSCGNAVRDRTLFTDRFETMVARSGSGLRTRGGRGVLQRIHKSMKASGLVMQEWSFPHDLHESLEMKKKVPVASGDPDAGQDFTAKPSP